MPDQLNLFGDRPVACLYPQVSGLSGYRYGCRCPRCGDAKRAWRSTVTCAVCPEPRMRNALYCAEHRGEELAMRQAARAVERAERTRALVVDCRCEIDGREYRLYQSVLDRYTPRHADLSRRICSTCRKPYRRQITGHRLSVVDALALIRATVCPICQRQLPRGLGRVEVDVDHDHACCPGAWSCGECVRGFICRRCNLDVGAVEKLGPARLARIADYLSVATRE